MKSFYKLDSEKRKNEDLMKKLLAEATIKSEENERKRIGENLHDEIAPILLLASRKLESYKYLHVNNNLDDINSALEYIDSGITRIRDISRELHPSALESFGLLFALQDFGVSMESSKVCEIEISTNTDNFQIEPFNQLMLFRIIQELIINAVKHGNASQFNIIFMMKDEHLELNIFHNGSPFLQEDYIKNLHNYNTSGLKYIAQRLELMRSSLNFTTNSEISEQCIELIYPLN
ncbi:MAG: hypothetical protein IPO62_17975 [Saprospiraceae bacterium]|nr:hypothetical protein [Saprospiraceae bacterium]